MCAVVVKFYHYELCKNPSSSHSVCQRWLTCLSFKIIIGETSSLYTLNGIQLKNGQIYFIPAYSWVDSNSGHLLHFAGKPNAAIIHISTDLNLNHLSCDRPCIYKSVRLIQAKRAVPVGFSLKLLEADDSAWTAPRQYGRHHRLACIPFASV